MADQPTVWASLGCTINIGNYENQKIDVGVTGVPHDATPEQIDQIMQRASMTLHQVVDGLAAEMGRRLKEDYGR